jgi:primary-amine oxidase
MHPAPARIRPPSARARPTVAALALGLALHAAAAPAQQTPARHPLDPLTREEIAATVDVLARAGRVTPERRFAVIDLHEPPKRQVHEDLAAGRARRSAFALLYDWATRTASEAVVDLDRRAVASWRDLPSGEPPLRHITISRLNEVVKADPRFQETLRSRGIAGASRLTLLADLAEGQPLAERGGDRFVGATAFLNDGAPPAMIVHGLEIEVNLTRGTVSRYVDNGPGAGPPADGSDPYGGGRAEIKRLETVQPDGPGFEVRGSEVRWQNWRLHFGVHPRRGLELFDVAYEDGGRARPVLYRASVSEMIAPYGDPSFASWYPRDEGDYGLANYSRVSAIPEADAPAHAVFASATMFDSRGAPVEVPRAVALFERDGGVLWRHGAHSRRARQLVLASYATVDNYDYVFHWIFGQDGALEVQVQLTGIMNFNRTERQRDTLGAHGAHASFGHLVAPGVNAPNHQHFFSFRLDFDVDGAGGNRVVEMDTEAVPRGPENPKGEWFAMRERPLATEREARRTLDLARSRRWKVVNPGVTNELGQPSGYVLVPGENSLPYPAPGSEARLRAGFLDAHLWVTQYRPEEMYASGDYVNLGGHGEGLPRWTGADRPLDGQDVVVWYTLGVTHLPRAEDWPIMPSHTTGFRIVPAGFFSRNPAIDVPGP